MSVHNFQEQKLWEKACANINIICTFLKCFLVIFEVAQFWGCFFPNANTEIYNLFYIILKNYVVIFVSQGCDCLVCACVYLVLWSTCTCVSHICRRNWKPSLVVVIVLPLACYLLSCTHLWSMSAHYNDQTTNMVNHAHLIGQQKCAWHCSNVRRVGTCNVENSITDYIIPLLLHFFITIMTRYKIYSVGHWWYQRIKLSI